MFIERWREPLGAAAQIEFIEGEVTDAGTYAQKADSFVTAHGYKAIGFNWELLDSSADEEAPRSALAAMIDALATDMEYPSRPWLGEERARECAADFIGMFEPDTRTIMSNRLGDLWNPLTDARIEWAFVGYDRSRIALLVATR